jgi:DNA processing protein
LTDRTALVALLRSTYAKQPAVLRQRLLEGERAIDISAELGADLADAEREIAGWTEDGNQLITYLDDAYPAQMREVHDFPLVLFARGEVVGDDKGVCIVGSRDPGPAALDAAVTVAEYLVHARVTVVSGLARGIDAAAHTAALNSGGRTVGILGTGIDRYSPASSRPIQKQMEARGLVLSQFWPGFGGNRAAFPMRNAVMSGYGRVTIILAAAENSGTRHQARQALAHGRPLVLSRNVATQTSWGKRYSEGSANEVAVAASPREAADLALALIERTAMVTLTRSF